LWPPERPSIEDAAPLDDGDELLYGSKPTTREAPTSEVTRLLCPEGRGSLRKEAEVPSPQSSKHDSKQRGCVGAVPPHGQRRVSSAASAAPSGSARGAYRSGAGQRKRLLGVRYPVCLAPKCSSTSRGCLAFEPIRAESVLGKGGPRETCSPHSAPGPAASGWPTKLDQKRHRLAVLAVAFRHG